MLEGLKARGLTLGTAESCTGGLIAKRLTDVSGSSQVFRGGVVSYTNEVKHGVLGVPRPCWTSTARCPSPWPGLWQRGRGRP